MEQIIQSMLGKKNWAVIGATNNKTKYGNKIYNLLKSEGYNVFPVNPVYETVEGDTCYNNLSEISADIDCISVVVPPERGVAYIEEAASLGIKQMWFQPGTFDEDLLDLCEEKNIEMVYYACVLVELPKHK